MHLTLFVCLLFDTQRSSADIEVDGEDEAARVEAHCGAVRWADLRWAGLWRVARLRRLD